MSPVHISMPFGIRGQPALLAYPAEEMLWGILGKREIQSETKIFGKGSSDGVELQ